MPWSRISSIFQPAPTLKTNRPPEDPNTRGALLDERIEPTKALWTYEPAEYHGKYVNFDASYSKPKPVRQPHPPIFIGGDSNATVSRVIRRHAGWISNPLPWRP